MARVSTKIAHKTLDRLIMKWRKNVTGYQTENRSPPIWAITTKGYSAKEY